MIVLRFSTDSGSLISALIRWRTESKISHVEFELPTGWTFGARFSLRGKIGRWFRIKRWQRLDGIQLRPPEDNANQTNVIRATFPGLAEAFIWACKNRAHWPYDLLGIAGIISAQGWHSRRARFCSDLIEEAAAAVGQPLLNCDPAAIAPRDLLISPSLQILSDTPGAAGSR